MDRALYKLLADVELDHWWFVARRRIVRDLLARVLPPDPAAIVVDVGCGAGANIASLAPYYRCFGIDPSEDAIRFARERFPGVEFRAGNVPEALGDLASRASGFLLMDVLEHVADDAALLAALFERASPGALALITVPADMRLWSPHDESHGHFRRYEPALLRRAWQGLPVRERLLSPFNSRLYPLVRAVRTLTRVRKRAWGRDGSDVSVPPAPMNRLLEACFAGEAPRLSRLLGGRGRPYRHGVSLIAILERVPGEKRSTASRERSIVSGSEGQS